MVRTRQNLAPDEGPASPRTDPRRGAPPPPQQPFSPSFFRSAFPAAAAADTEHPCVSLLEWWLKGVEGDEKKLAVAGVFKKCNHKLAEFTSEPIAKRHEPCTLETEDGIVVILEGSMNISRMLDNGFSIEVCEKFVTGFPYWWDSWYERYPKTTSSDSGSQPSTSSTRNAQADATRFYLEQYLQGNYLNSMASSFIRNLIRKTKSVSENDADAFQNFPCLVNGTPRFEEYTCGDVVTTNEAGSNDDSERNADINLSERVHDDSDISIPLAPVVERTNDKDGLADHTPGKSACFERTQVASLKRQTFHRKSKRKVLREDMAPVEDMPMSVPSRTQSPDKPVGQKEKASAHVLLQGASGSTTIKSRVPYAQQSPLTRGRAKSLSMFTPESLKLRKTRSGRVVVPTLDAGCQRIIYDPDGLISGVIGLNSSHNPKGNDSEPPSRKRKRSRP